MLNHICYVADLVGPAHVGMGLDYVFDPHEIAEVRQINKEYLPDGTYSDDLPTIPPESVAELALGLMHRGWSDAEVGGFLGGNLRRVAQQGVEAGDEVVMKLNNGTEVQL